MTLRLNSRWLKAPHTNLRSIATEPIIVSRNDVDGWVFLEIVRRFLIVSCPFFIDDSSLFDSHNQSDARENRKNTLEINTCKHH